MYFITHPISSINHLLARMFTSDLFFYTSILFFIVLGFSYKSSRFKNLDRKVFELAKQYKNVHIKKLAIDCTIFGNAIFHISLSLLTAAIFFGFGKKIHAISILFVLIFSWGLNRLLKIIFRRERPMLTEGGTKKRKSFCFPSGHVMASISIYFFIGLIMQSVVSFFPFIIFALIISLIVIFTRVYLNHHFFTDVLGGIFMGIICLKISVWFYFFIGKII